MRRNAQKRLGNILILLSLLGFSFIYYPIAKVYLFPFTHTEKQIQNTQFSIFIPSIKAFALIVPNVDPFNRDEYLESLKKGVAHAKNSSFPDEGGTVFLFAHSSDVPWRMTRENTAFYKLNQVENGDDIILRRNGKTYNYKVYDKKSVWPNEVNYLIKPQGNILILQTCTPVGTSLKRLLVFAKQTF